MTMIVRNSKEIRCLYLECVTFPAPTDTNNMAKNPVEVQILSQKIRKRWPINQDGKPKYPINRPIKKIWELPRNNTTMHTLDSIPHQHP